MLDEYERALSELKAILRSTTEEEYSTIVDKETKNKDCRSIETMMTHVVRAGDAYVKYIRESLSIEAPLVEIVSIPLKDVSHELDRMFDSTAAIFEGRGETVDDELMNVYIDARWGIRYNIDQLLEHAVVHVLRHRRQTEKFLIKIRTTEN